MNKNIIWVIGCPRSGTTFLTNLIGQHTKYCFNEPWRKYPINQHKNWRLPTDGDIVFKYCKNCQHYKEINELYPNSKWIHIIRDPIHVIYSIAFAKPESHPIRNFRCTISEKQWDLANYKIINKKIKNAIQMRKSYIECCNKAEKALIINYENINAQKLSYFLNMKIENENFINRNLYFDENKMNFVKSIVEKENIF